MILLSCTTIAGTAAAGGLLIVRLEGTLGGPIPPGLTLRGPEREESVLLGPIALAAGEVRFENLEAGLYRIGLDQAGSSGSGFVLEVGVHEGLTTVVRAQIESGALIADPFRPDPFGFEDGWDARWLEALPGAGEEGALAAVTSPAQARNASVDGLDLTGIGFHHPVRVRGEGAARSVRSPVGTVSATEEEATRRILARSGRPRAGIEGATGDRGRTSWEMAIERGFDKAVGRPQLLASLRGSNYLDAAPSPFETKRLPHNGLDGLEIFTRLDMAPSRSARVSALLYGDGTRRNYFLEPYRYDAGHAPREDRAVIEGALRAVAPFGSRSRLLGELSIQRAYVATGDGAYFDDLPQYQHASGGADASGLYWLGYDPRTQVRGHIYNYFRRNVQVELAGRAEIWRDPGTEKAAGAGVRISKGVYRSFEYTNPVNPAALGQAIGYDALGESHDDAAGRKPGRPLVFAGYATARRPIAGGDLEVGARFTLYKSGQLPLRDLENPIGEDNTLGPEDLAAERSHVSVDPRIGYTFPVGARNRIWLTGGRETRIPPPEAIYYSAEYLERTAYAVDPTRPPDTIFGNPALEPEGAWTALAAAGRRIRSGLWAQVGLLGERVEDAITPRLVAVGQDSLAFYVSDRRRDLIDLLARAHWEPSPRFAVRASYDLSRGRTESVEPSLLDGSWYAEDLPLRGVNSREGFPLLLPSADSGADRSLHAALRDRRHRISVAVMAEPPEDVLGDAGRVLFRDLEIGGLLRIASGGSFTWTQVYPAGLLDRQSPPLEATGRERNAGRLPWTWQLDLRAARTLWLLGGEAQIWAELMNVTDRRNVVRVYQATGEPYDDGWLESRDGREAVSDRGAAFADAYRTRIRDLRNYGEPRLLRAGLRVQVR